MKNAEQYTVSKVLESLLKNKFIPSNSISANFTLPIENPFKTVAHMPKKASQNDIGELLKILQEQENKDQDYIKQIYDSLEQEHKEQAEKQEEDAKQNLRSELQAEADVIAGKLKRMGTFQRLKYRNKPEVQQAVATRDYLNSIAKTI